MTLEIAPKQQQPIGPLPEAVEQVLVHGDLSKLSTQERLKFYVARCEAAGLDARSRPFQYINLQGKLVLYATKECAEQLNGKHGISHAVESIDTDEKAGLVEVKVRATMSGNRSTMDIGVVPIAGLKGADLANARMKAVTKAKRRATLSLCGLGDIIDESELDTVESRVCSPTGQMEPPKNDSGFGRGQYASEEATKQYVQKMQAYLDRREQEFLDFWSLKCNGELPDSIPARQICRIFQLDNHLVKWAIETGRLDPASAPEGIQNRQVGRYTAIVYFRSKEDQGALAREARDYLDKLITNLNEKILREHPELRSEGDLEEATDADYDAILDERTAGNE